MAAKRHWISDFSPATLATFSHFENQQQWWLVTVQILLRRNGCLSRFVGYPWVRHRFLRVVLFRPNYKIVPTVVWDRSQLECYSWDCPTTDGVQRSVTKQGTSGRSQRNSYTWITSYYTFCHGGLTFQKNRSEFRNKSEISHPCYKYCVSITLLSQNTSRTWKDNNFRSPSGYLQPWRKTIINPRYNNVSVI